MHMKKLFTLTLLAFVTLGVKAQTWPQAFNLSNGNFSFSQWDSLSTPGSYPSNMVFHTDTALEPTASAQPFANWPCRYNLRTRARINGLGTRGISFLLTQNRQIVDSCMSNDSAYYPSDATVALSSLGRKDITVTWVGEMTANGSGSPTPREFRIAMQYRIGSTGAWIDMPNNEFNSGTASIGVQQTIGPLVLPSAADNQSLVQIRWKYYQSNPNNFGSRPQLRLDDIVISSTPSTGIFQNNIQSLQIYPNPSNGVYQINAEESINTITVKNMICQQLIQINSGLQTNNQLDLTALPSGVYMVELGTINQHKAIVKLIKQ